MKPTNADEFLRDGCGRCEHYRTPACKVHPFRSALEVLRASLLARGLEERIRWGFPCYALDGKNVAMISAFRDRCALQFFEGAAFDDGRGELLSPGPNSRYARYLAFDSEDAVRARHASVERWIDLAIAHARSGRRFEPPASDASLPAELERLLDADPALRRAFEALTPGRRRSHALHVAGAKQSATRVRRAEACVPFVLAGKGHQER